MQYTWKRSNIATFDMPYNDQIQAFDLTILNNVCTVHFVNIVTERKKKAHAACNVQIFV